MDEARTHALKASVLIEGVGKLEERLENLTPDETAQMVVSGGFTRVNRDVQHTVQMAIANALAALALAITEKTE